MRFEKLFLGSAVFLLLCGALLLSKSSYADCPAGCQEYEVCSPCPTKEDPNKWCCDKGCACRETQQSQIDKYILTNNIKRNYLFDTSLYNMIIDGDKILIQPKFDPAALGTEVIEAPAMIRREAVQAPAAGGAAKEAVKKEGFFRFFRGQ